MARKLLLQPWETAASETWAWKTDILSTIGNDEQRIALRDYPDESLSITMRFGIDGVDVLPNESPAFLSGADALVRSFRELIVAKGEVTLPMWHLADDLDPISAVFTTSTKLSINCAYGYSPFQVFSGERVLVQANGLWYNCSLDTWDTSANAGIVNFTVAPGFTANQVQKIVPLRDGLVDTSNEDFSRAASAGSVRLEVSLSRLSGGNRVLGNTGFNLNTGSFQSLPILDVYNLTESLPIDVEHGLTKIETASNFPYYVTRWKEAQFSFKFRDTFRRATHKSVAQLNYPRSVPNCLYHFATDDVGAQVVNNLLVFVPSNITNSPTVAGTGGGLDVRSQLGLRTGYAGSSRSLQAPGSAALINNPLIDPASSCTLILWLNCIDVESSAGRPFTNRSSTVGSLGLIVQRTTAGNFDVRVGDGAIEQLIIAPAIGSAAVGQHMLVIRKTGLLFEVLDGTAAIGSASAASLPGGSIVVAPAFGGTTAGTAPTKSNINEFAFFNRALNNGELADLQAYGLRWSKPQNIPNARRMTGRLPFWRNFLNRLRGSQGVFWLPERRSDFTIVSSVGTVGCVLAGRQYYDLWSETNVKALCLDDEVNPLRVVQVVDVELDGSGNTVVQYGADYGITAKTVSLAFPCRASDAATFTHDSQFSDITLDATSVRFDGFTPLALPVPAIDVAGDDPGRVIISSAIDSIPDQGTIGGVWTAAASGQRFFPTVWRGRNSAYMGTGSRWFVPGPALTNYDWLCLRAQDMTLIARVKATALSFGSANGLLMTLAGNTFRFYIVNNELTLQCAGGVSMTTSGAAIPATGDLSIMLRRKGGVTSIYISLTQGSPFVFLLSSAAAGSATAINIGTLILGWNGFTRFTLGRLRIWKSALLSGQYEFARQQLVTDWPDRTPELLKIDGSVGTYLAGETVSVPVSGEYPGTMLPLSAKPEQAPANGLYGPRFDGGAYNPTSRATGKVFGYWRTDVEPEYTGTVYATGTGINGVTINGIGNVDFPVLWIRTAPGLGGPRDLASYQYSVDSGVTWSLPELYAASLVIGPFIVTCPDGTYADDHLYKALVTNIPDFSGEANHLGMYGAGMTVNAKSLNGRSGWLATGPSGGVGQFQRALLTNSRSIGVSSRMTMIVVGNSGPTPNDSILVGADYSARVVYIQPGGTPSIASSAHGALASPVTANKPFIYVARWNGASSNIQYKQLGMADLAGVVNPVDPAAIPFTAFAWGGIVSNLAFPCDGMTFYACLAVDESTGAGALSDADLGYHIQGLCREYGFPSDFADDFLTSSVLAPADLTFLHDNSINWALSLACNFDATLSPSLVVFECVDAALTMGFRFSFNSATAAVVCEFVGASGTTTQSLVIGYLFEQLQNQKMVIELRFTRDAVNPFIEVLIDEVSKGSLSFSGHIFNAATQTAAIKYGRGRGFALFECLVRSDFTSQAKYLRNKWFPGLWADLVLNINGDLIVNADSDLITT